MSNICHACGQDIKEAREHEMTGYMVDMLRIAADHVVFTGVNNFKKGELDFGSMGKAAYGNFPQLRYFGLIANLRDKDTGKRLRRWVITRNGWAFLRGEFECRKSVVIKNNSIQDGLSTSQKTDIKRVGKVPMQTDFLYYDDDGQMVGLRPNIGAKPTQASLL